MIRVALVLGLSLTGCKKAGAPDGASPSPESAASSPELPADSDERVKFKAALEQMLAAGDSGAWTTDVALFDVTTGEAEPWASAGDAAGPLRGMLLDDGNYRFNMHARCRPFYRAAVRVTHQPEAESVQDATGRATAVFFVAGPRCPKVRVRWGAGDWAAAQWSPELADGAAGSLMLDYLQEPSDALLGQLSAVLDLPTE